MSDLEIFQHKPNDDEYRAWLAANPNGYVLNIDEPQSWEEYPKVHTAQCKAISNRRNYTTGKYYKVCSNSISALEKYSQQTHGKKIIFHQCVK